MTVRTMLVIAVLAVFAVAIVVAGCASPTPTPTTTTTQPSTTPSTAPSTQPSSTTPTTSPTPPSPPTVTGTALGKMIWETGADNSGPVTWTQGVPNKMKGGACKQCHGLLGKGGPNGAPNITYPKIKGTLKTEALFARAVSKGLDEAGKPLDKKMPRYGNLAPEDLTGLWDFVKALK
jgi:hypothetical protein